MTVSKKSLFILGFQLPLLFAEFSGIGRVNLPWTANLVLCARTAHQDGLVGNTEEFRHPKGKQTRAAFSGYSFGL